jgi:hypothetical protein
MIVCPSPPLPFREQEQIRPPVFLTFTLRAMRVMLGVRPSKVLEKLPTKIWGKFDKFMTKS